MAIREKMVEGLTKGVTPSADLVLYAAGLGAVTGLRSFTAAALLGQAIQTQSIPPTAEPFGVLNSPTTADVSSGLALAELVGDKLSFTPNRTDAFPLAARAFTGAFVGGALCSSFKRKAGWGALAGAVGAIGAAYAGFFLRKALTKSQNLPDLLVALVEDAVAIGGAIAILRSVDLPVADLPVADLAPTDPSSASSVPQRS